jgi:hypothetical protein
MARKRPNAKDSQVWMYIINFANAKLQRDEEALKNVMRLLSLLDTHITFAGIPDLNRGVAKIHSDAKQHQTNLRQFLTWLCQPKTHSELDSWALKFLNRHAGVHIKIRFEEFDPRLRRFDELRSGRPIKRSYPRDYRPYLQRFIEPKDILDPICDFIARHFTGYGPPPPIRSCKRSGCDQFVFVERRGRKAYCSDSCRVKDHYSRAKARTYARVYRAAKRRLREGKLKSRKSLG